MTAQRLTDVRGGMQLGKTAFLSPTLFQKPEANVAHLPCRMLQLYPIHYAEDFCVHPLLGP